MRHSSAELIKLPRGGSVTITRFGAFDGGLPFFYLHGYPGSRLEGELAHAAAEKLGLSVIAIDRPGFGGTPDTPRRKLRHFPELLEQLAGELGVERFGIFGVSGGAPYALASAAMLRERIPVVGIISGMGPLDDVSVLERMIPSNRRILRAARHAPVIGYGMALLIAKLWRKNPEHMVRALRTELRGHDRELLGSEDVAAFLIKNVTEALAQGGASAARELRLLVTPWDVPLSEITARVLFWHGDSDEYVPIELAQACVKSIPSATLKAVAGKGHFMVLVMLEEILEALKREFLEQHPGAAGL